METIGIFLFWFTIPLVLVDIYSYTKSDSPDMSDDFRTVFDWYDLDDEE